MSEYEEFWLSPEDLIEINKIVGGAGASVSNYEGICSNAERPMTDVFGHKEFPTIWDKAACLLHSIANTQYFTDGNKRTAWEACRHFLMAHGETIRPMPWMNKGSIILNAAVDTLSIPEVAQWLYLNRLQASDRVDYAVLAMPSVDTPPPVDTYAAWSYRLPAQLVTVKSDSKVAFVAVLTRLHWFDIDQGNTKKVSIQVRDSDDPPYEIDPSSSVQVTGEVEAFWENPIFPNGYQSWTEYFVLKLNVFRYGQNFIEILIDGEVAWSDSFTIEEYISVPDHLLGLH